MKLTRTTARMALSAVLAATLAVGGFMAWRVLGSGDQTVVVAYFDNSNGIYVGDDVLIAGVRVGKIDKIEPQPLDAKITFSLDNKYRVPADVNAVILTPALVSARAIQLTPTYSSGPVLSSGAVIPRERTAVPMEWDDLRKQLEKLTAALQPTEPGGVSTLGSFINTAADNVRGQGANIREALIQASQVFSALGDHKDDIFASVKNLSTLVAALNTTNDVIRQLNDNFAAVTGVFDNDPNEVAGAVKDLNDVVVKAQRFVADNREAVGAAADKLAPVTQALIESIDDIKQLLHVAPNSLANFTSIYEPAGGALTGALAVNNFSNPIQFLCGAIQAASRLGSEQAAKLCVQYLAPIVKNRQFNFPPFGANPFVGAQARPNEVTFSEDWLRPLTEAGRVRDFYEGTPQPAAAPDVPSPTPMPGAAEASTPTAGEPAQTDPNSGLAGMMLPAGGGS
ncbi:Mce family protein Mce3D [Mycolicibacterium anyangense]|uniref:Mce family protein Mce3D n=1 Tax=Mycolicibacterium anyangense TaxID=1431246 RepID=A0A6N4W7X3_9MYCO|nr:Mce family protein Mce3D [Mycolicibacterium anyangense]